MSGVAGAAPTIQAVDPSFGPTALILFAAAVILLVYEGWTLKDENDNYHPITHVVRSLTHKWPLFPFLMGVLAGHFWW